MFAKKITYTDYNGIERTETYLFNLNKAEIMEMELSTTGGLTEMITRIVETQDGPALIKIFKDLILKSYGVKSVDGKRFIKSEELRNEFEQTEAYSSLFMELATNDVEAVKFVKGIIPSDAAEQIESAGGIDKIKEQMNMSLPEA